MSRRPFRARARAATARFLVLVAACAWSSLAPAATTPALTAGGGNPAPMLVLQDMDGGLHDLTRYRGQVVLINFWATWCVPCREEMPSMQRLRERLAGKPFAVLAINVDEPEARIRRFMTETRLDLPVLLDRNKTVTRAWGVRVMPTTFVIGPDGRVRFRAVGEMDWSDEAVVGRISQLLNGG